MPQQEEPAIDGTEYTGAEALGVDTFIEALVQDECAPPDVRVLAGYLGHSSRGSDWWRLYLTLELNHFVEFHGDDVVHCVRLATEANPLAGNVVWVRRDADLWHMNVRSRPETAHDFVQGDISRRHLPWAADVPAPTGWDAPVDPPSFGRAC